MRGSERVAGELAVLSDPPGVSPAGAGVPGDGRAPRAACVATWWHDLDTGEVWHSPRLPEALGAGPDGGVDPAVRAHLREAIDVIVAAARQSESGAEFDEERMLGDPASPRWVHVHARVDGAGSGRVLHGTVVDTTEYHRSREELGHLVERFRLLTEVSPDGVAVHQDMRIVYANPAAIGLIADSDPDRLVGKPVVEFVHPDDRPAMVARIQHLDHAGDASKAVSMRLRRADGSTLPAEVTSVRTTWLGRPAYQIIFRDLTAEMLAMAERRRAEELYSSVVASLEEGVVVLDRDGLVEHVNQAAGGILGRGSGGLVGMPLAELGLLDEQRVPLPGKLNPFIRARMAGEVVQAMTVGVLLDRTIRWVSVNARPLGAGEDAPFRVVASLTDVTERRRAADDLLREATHDALTGLANRSVVGERITAAVARSSEAGAGVAVLFLDLDNFKVVNDSLGHGAGDGVLTIVAKRLRRAVRETDTVARLGGDEFVVVAEGIETVEQAEALARRLGSVITRPIRLTDRHLVVNVSIGIAIAWEPGAASAEELLRDADVALYQAKGAGRGRHAIFDADLRHRALRRLHLETDLRRALDERSLSLVYQPIVSLGTGQPLGVEALLRWSTSRYGSVSPTEFVPIAEETGLILDIGRQVFRMACAQVAAWRAEYPALRDLHVSVNLSPRQFADQELIETVEDALSAGGLPGSALWVEITEGILMEDTAQALTKLHALRDIGARVAIDDFGTGYSSLAYLRRLPVDALKIDRSFVSDMMSGDSLGDSDVIVPTIVGLAHNLGLEVIAEGVETAEQLALLDGLGCDHVQGYLLGRPQAPADLPPLLLPAAHLATPA